MRDIDELFQALSRSQFRSRFRLSEKDADYLETKGLDADLIDHIVKVLKRWLEQQKPQFPRGT